MRSLEMNACGELDEETAKGLSKITTLSCPWVFQLRVKPEYLKLDCKLPSIKPGSEFIYSFKRYCVIFSTALQLVL